MSIKDEDVVWKLKQKNLSDYKTPVFKNTNISSFYDTYYAFSLTARNHENDYFYK